MDNLTVSRDSFLWAFSMMSQLHGVAIPLNLILLQHEPPYTIATIQRAAQGAGFNVSLTAIESENLDRLSLPCLALVFPANDEDRCTEWADSSALRVYQLALIERTDQKWITFNEALSRSSTILSVEDFGRRFARRVLITTPVKPVPAGKSLLSGGVPKLLPQFRRLKTSGKNSY